MSYDVNVFQNPNQCGCDCGPQGGTGDVIFFTSDEVNQILADGPINCSTRFSKCIDKVKETNLNDAIEMVPQKFRSAARMLIFLNEKGNPEIWIYKGVSERTWFDLKYWVNVPTGASSFSDIYTILDSHQKTLNRIEEDIKGVVKYNTIKGIEVVDKAPGLLDDILYFEYLPKPERSVYDIQVGYSEPVVSNDLVNFDVNLYTKVIGESGYSKVRVLVEVFEKPTNSHVDISYMDRDGSDKQAMDIAYYGGQGFSIDPDFSEHIPMGMSFAGEGLYSIRFSLVEVGTGTKIEFYNMTVDVQ